MSLNAETVKAALDKAASDPDNAWAIMSSLILDLATRLDALESNHAKLFNGTVSLAKESRGMRKALHQLVSGAPPDDGSDVAAPQGDAQGAPPAVVGGPVVETDAGPVTDPSLLEAELAMEAAAGPRGGEVAPPPRRQRRPQRGRSAPSSAPGGSAAAVSSRAWVPTGSRSLIRRSSRPRRRWTRPWVWAAEANSR